MDTVDIVTKLSRDFAELKQLVKGNGSKRGSIVGRLDDLEDRMQVVESYPCRNGCIFLRHEEEVKDMREKKRNWRIGDIANYIQLLMLLLIVYGMFK